MYNSGNNNPYIYTYQNPLRYIDPNGKQNDVVVRNGVEYRSVLLTQKTVVWEGQAQKYRVQTVNEEVVWRTKSGGRTNDWIGGYETEYRVYSKDSNSYEIIKGMDAAGKFNKKYPNNYDYDALQAYYNAYDKNNEVASFGSDASLIGELANKTKFANIIGRITTGYKVSNALITMHQAYKVNDQNKIKEIMLDMAKDFGIDYMAKILGKLKNSDAEKQFKGWVSVYEKTLNEIKKTEKKNEK